MNIALEILLIFVLTILNGLFAGSEMALITIRKSHVASLVAKKKRGADLILKLQETPESMFATIQVGISVLTVIASAFAGNNLTDHFAAWLRSSSVGFISVYSNSIAFVLVVALVSYVTLVLGELVPKSLGLRYANALAPLAAYPVWYLWRASYWLVWFLDKSSNILLKPLHDSTNFSESRISEEELRSFISEGKKAGTIDEQEHAIIENVFEFSELTVGKIMTPRTQIIAFDINDPQEEIFKKVIESEYSRIPIYEGSLNTIVGILNIKSLLKNLYATQNVSLRDMLYPPYFVPNTMHINKVLQRLQRKKLHVAFVTDEHGEVEGMVTMEDILEELVGEIRDETDDNSSDIVEQKDGSYLVSGQLSIVDFNKFFDSNISTESDYTTLSGFIIDTLERFPQVGDVVSTADNVLLVVKEKTLRTVKLVNVIRLIAR